MRHSGKDAASDLQRAGVALFVLGSMAFVVGAAYDCVYTARRLNRWPVENPTLEYDE